jgi:hypothetical protein
MPKSYWSAQQAYSWAVYGDETIIGSRQVPPPQRRSFQVARAAIRNGIAKHQLTGSVLVGGQRRPLDPQQFRDFNNMAIDECGDIVPLVPYRNRDLPIEGTRVRFSEREIKSLFPVDIDMAEDWMRHYMAHNPTAKKSTAVTECRNKSGLTARAADEAWRKIGPGLGRGCGKRIKVPKK